MIATESGSAKPKILIVEDEPLISMMLEEMLLDAGCLVAGNAQNLREALPLAEAADFDLAILDLSLGSESSLPVAEVLARRERPFMFASGYGSTSLPVEHRDRIVLDKPFHFTALVKKLELALPGWVPPADL
ncbi:response regulator [Bosea sp. BIWAKO-01]|uniref:response regulator n=1 Tax=Bosea sp. BIWAKO-01 TaxID=506668 RepID=UPI00086B266F|nr:response regulator [Bosea sp. BIWAKO-01]GAU86480.1 two-component response regulator [Bosea sp. BIWAKO-01]